MCVSRVPYFNSLEIRESGAKTAARRALPAARTIYCLAHIHASRIDIKDTRTHT